jgi:hypothetical protein
VLRVEPLRLACRVRPDKDGGFPAGCGEPSPHRWLMLVPEPAFSGDDGRFLLTGVLPGNYRLYAWAEELPGFLHLDPAFLHSFAAYSVKVHAEANAQLQVEIAVIPVLR